MSRSNVNWLVVAARGLASVLAGALLLCEVLTADGSFHQALHSGGKAASNNCILCLFAKGQVDLPETAPRITAFVWSTFDSPMRMESIALVDFRYLISPSRAPPAFSFRPTVVA